MGLNKVKEILVNIAAGHESILNDWEIKFLKKIKRSLEKNIPLSIKQNSLLEELIDLYEDEKKEIIEKKDMLKERLKKKGLL